MVRQTLAGRGAACVRTARAGRQGLSCPCLDHVRAGFPCVGCTAPADARLSEPPSCPADFRSGPCPGPHYPPCTLTSPCCLAVPPVVLGACWVQSTPWPAFGWLIRQHTAEGACFSLRPAGRGKEQDGQRGVGMTARRHTRRCEQSGIFSASWQLAALKHVCGSFRFRHSL